MQSKNYFAFAMVCALSWAVPASADDSSGPPIAVNPVGGVPVFPYDIKDRPYKVLGEITAGVRKATIFSHSADQAKIYRELWERGKKLGADAVIKASYGDAHVTALSWGSTTATGTAIKFTGPASGESADAAAAAPAPAVADAAPPAETPAPDAH